MVRELSRKERERLSHRLEMLEAAERLFSREDYYGTTMQEIAEEAEFSVGALYKMFESKEDLYLRLIEMRAEQYFESVCERIEAASGPLEKIRSVIATKLDFFQEHKAFFRVFSHLSADERRAPPFGMSRQCMEKYLGYQGNLRDIFQEGIRQGVFVDQDPTLMVLCLEGMCNAVMACWVRTGGEELGETQPGELESLFFHGVLAEGKQ